MNSQKQFNLIIAGLGGQGLITLLKILAEAALAEGYDVKTSELHGLSQRGGSVETHLRFGKIIYSPLVSQGRADLILGLEPQEALNAGYYAGPRTTFLIDQAALKSGIKNMVSVPASAICQEKLGNKVVAGVYLLGFASFKKLIPLKPASVLKAIKKVVKPEYFELNEKAFRLASNHQKV